MPTGQREPLNRQRILTTALALVDAEGIAALSMRRLAQQHLAVSTMGPVPPGSPSGDDRGELLG